MVTSGKSDDEIRAAMGDKFPKHIYHSIICIGALVAHQDNDRWVVDVLGAPSVAKRSEKELIDFGHERNSGDTTEVARQVGKRLCPTKTLKVNLNASGKKTQL